MISVRDMKSKKPIIITAFLTFLLLMLIVVYMINPQPVNAMMVEFSSMEKQGKHVYVEPDISEVTTTILLNDFEQSRERVSGFFEDLKDNPTLLFVQSPHALEKYAQKNRTGQTYYTCWGNYIVIGPDGFNADVIAHELMHSELRKRLKNKDKVPVWFDEGLATLVDYRYNSDKFISFDKINELSSRDDFYEPSHVKENYEIAHSEINRWFGIVGKSGLVGLIDGLNNGEEFKTIYKSIESQS